MENSPDRGDPHPRVAAHHFGLLAGFTLVGLKESSLLEDESRPRLS